MHRTQKYSLFVYFETVFVYFETPWAMNRHFMSKKKRAHSGDLTLTVAALDDTTRRIENHPVKGHALPAGQRPTNFEDNKNSEFAF